MRTVVSETRWPSTPIYHALSQEDPAGYLNGLTVEFEIDGVLNGKRAVAGESRMHLLKHEALEYDVVRQMY